jgi:type I restriction enzyme S subunit
MSEWKRIDSIASIRRGASPRPISDPRYFGGDVGWVRIIDVTGSKRFLRETEQYLSPLGESLSVRVNPGDLVMSICGTLGRPIVIDMPACIHDGFVQFSNLRDTDTSFLFYALQHAEPAFCAMGQPGTQTNLNTSLVGRHVIFCPEKSEQHRIAEILSTLDETIEQTEALIAKNQQIKAGLMHDLFTRGVTSDGKLRPTRAEAPQLYKESPLGWIPKEWEVQRLDVVADVSRGKFTIRPRNDPRFYGGQYPFIQTGDVALSGGRTLSSYTQTLNEMGLSVSRLFPAGTIMVTIAANIADTCLTGIPMCAPDSLVGVQPKAREDARFIELGIRRRKAWLAARAPQTAQRNINLEDLRPLLIPWPQECERSQISEIYETQDVAIEGCETQVYKLQKQKHGLMHDLLTGRVRVKVDD